MEAPYKVLRRNSRHQRCRRISIIFAIAVAAILILVIPLATILPNRNHSSGWPAAILLPLYIYPTPGAWDPLYKVLRSNPSLNFTVIINPEDGPGPGDTPGVDYVVGIQNLTRFANVRPIGYVRTQWATRNLTSVLEDVQTYSSRAKINSTSSNPTPMAMHGIFFDESPSEYSEEAAEYLSTINKAAKSATGFLAGRTVVHNPGTVPDARLDYETTEIVVAFEANYSAFAEDAAALASLPLGRSRYSFMVHSAPSSNGGLHSLVGSMSQHAEYLFATDLSENYYQSFSSDWTDFVNAIPT